jgi:hypothetical protein
MVDRSPNSHLENIICLVILLTSSWVNAQAYDTVAYSPMAIEGATWVIFDDEGFYSPPGYRSSYVIRISGDSIVNDHKYKKMYAANLLHGHVHPDEVVPPYQIDSFSLLGLVRDDSTTRRFLGIMPDYLGQVKEEERLIHDFGMHSGALLLGIYKPDTLAVDNVDVDTIFGKVRRYQRSVNGRVFFEGIGNTSMGPLCPNPALSLNMGYRRILSYCIGSETECEIDLLSNLDILQDVSRTIEVYPNPSQSLSILSINRPTNRSEKVKLVTIDGKHVSEYNLVAEQAEIQLPELIPGHYILVSKRWRKVILVTK